jgi:hypothetical protein
MFSRIGKRSLGAWLHPCAAAAMLVFAHGDGRTASPEVRSLSPQTVASRRADLNALARGYVAHSGSFTATARARARQLVFAARRHAASASNVDFFLDVARVIALSDNGHDSIDKGNSTLLPAVALPLRMVWMGEDLVITRARREYAELVGARVERVGMLTPQQLFLRYREYQGGKESYRRINPMWLVQNPAVLEAIGATANPERTPVTVQLASGKEETRVLNAISSTEAPHLNYPAGSWSTYLSDPEKAAGWTALGKAPPMYLQDPDRYFQMAELPMLDALYVQLRINMSMPGEEIEPFVAAVSQRLASPPRNAVVDLRFDTGGDIGTTLELMRQIGRRVPGRIFVITSPYTFSAGIVSTAALLQAGGKKVTVVGEDVGDRTHWWSEHKGFCLPHSKACAAIQTGYWDLVRGCNVKPNCYGDQFGVRVPAIRTDIPVSPSAEEWRRARDPALTAIAHALNRER